MREIADAVSVRPAAIYYWYRDKEAILATLQNDFLDGLTEAVDAAIESETRPERRLGEAVRQHVMFHGSRPRFAFVADNELRALSGATKAQVMAKRDAYEARFVNLLDEGVEAGVFRLADVRIATYAVLLQCTGVAAWFRADGIQSLEEVARIHIELVLGSVGVQRRAIDAASRASGGRRG